VIDEDDVGDLALALPGSDEQQLDADGR